MKPGMKADLRLRVIQQYGVNAGQDAIVTFSEDDQLGAASLGHLLPQAEFAWLADAHCTVHWQALWTTSAWWLRHGSQIWACTVNDAPLAYGESVMLHTGDRIELGMLCLEVLDSPVSSSTAASVAAPVPEQTGQNVADTAADGIAYRDANPRSSLSDLADGERWEHPAGSLAPWADPFDIVRSTELPASRFLPEAGTAADVSDHAADDKRRVLQREHDVLAGLANEYVQAIVDPASLHAQQMSAGSVAVAASRLKTPEQLAAQLDQHASLEDLLSGPMTMDQVLAQLGTEDAATCRIDSGHDDILRLFANGILANDIRARPPALTRREHHAISPDSHYTPGQAAGKNISSTPQQTETE